MGGMQRLRLGVLAVCVVWAAVSGRAEAQTGEPVKPYILFIADTSTSMEGATGFGSPSCANGDTRINHLKCALANIVNGYGDMIMALGRFRQRSSRNDCSRECGMRGIDCQDCYENGNCSALHTSGDRFEVLVPLVERNQGELLDWVNFTCGTCDPSVGSDPELVEHGWTPIAGSLNGAKRYFQGLSTPGDDPSVDVQPYWTGHGADPIRADSLKNVFVNGAQCRPYIVIMLTDGQETCVPKDSNSDAPETAAAALLDTEVDTLHYRIETKPIGFGRTPGARDIEDLAHAGGALDVEDQFEGFYAQNEAELSVAISQIISDALKFEVCNGNDDDCDLQVDEGFEAKGSACDNGLFGNCRGTGTLQCSADGSGLECIIDTQGQPAMPEECNGLDDDCDDKVDEDNVCAGCTPIEICDGNDNDCDNSVDENLTRPCGTDVGECSSGFETCVGGNWQNCTAIGGVPETCDGADNDCDGTIDGFAEECVTLPGNVPGVGICQQGTRICPSDGSGQFGPCLGEVGPRTEVCDAVNNDCDSQVDEETGGDTCNDACGEGITRCIDGGLQCEPLSTPEPEICDGIDNDCDRVFDEDVPDNGPCDDNGALCQPGTLLCQDGEFRCIGGVERKPEACDCVDNDCDNQVDEQPPALCAGGESCVQCQCAFPCAAGEFPCPEGLMCSNGYCIIDPCHNVECIPDAQGYKTECADGVCMRSCDLLTCPGNLICRPSDGICVPNTCASFPEYCAENELCIDSKCVSDPCIGVDCTGGSYCFDGNCVQPCAGVECGDEQRCILGQCQADPCGGPCPQNQICDETTGQCRADPCRVVDCPAGLACNPQVGRCESDPCQGVSCPGTDQVCVRGSCYTPDQLLPPESRPSVEHVTAAGSGCSANNRSTPLLAAILLAGFLLVSRRRKRHPSGERRNG